MAPIGPEPSVPVRRAWLTARVLTFALATVATLAAVVSGCGSDGEAADPAAAPKLAGVVRTPPLDVSTVKLPDVSGPEPVDTVMKAPAGELLLVYFGYTSCPDICPTTLSDISVALGDLPEAKARKVTVAMATVDPDRDTAEVISGYLDHFVERSLPLRTEDPAQLKAATSAFGVRFEVADHAPGAEEYSVSHTGVTYVVDDTGTVSVEWPFGFDSADMAADLSALLDRPSDSPSDQPSA